MKRKYEEILIDIKELTADERKELISALLNEDSPTLNSSDSFSLTPKRKPNLIALLGFDEELLASLNRLKNENIDLHMLQNCVETLKVYGFKPRICVSAKESGSKYFINFKGFCGFHNREHRSNCFYCSLTGRSPDKIIIACHHTRTESEGKRIWRSVDFVVSSTFE